MKKINSLASFLLILCLFSAQRSTATHLDGAEIYYECIGIGEYVVTLELYTDCNSSQSIIPFKQVMGGCNVIGGGSNNYFLPIVDTIDATPICDSYKNTTWCNGGGLYGTQLLIYRDTIQVSEPLCANFRFIFWECCRNDAITNLPNPGNYEQLVYTEFDRTKVLYNSAPEFRGNMMAVAAVGQPFVYDPQVYDADGDSLSISWVPPVLGPFIYSGGAYIYGLPVNSSTPLIIDAQTGITKYTPNSQDYNIITYEILEYRNGVLIGKTYKDIAVYHLVGFGTNNSLPQHSINNTAGATVANDSFTVCSGTTISFDIVLSDSNTTDSLVLREHYLTNVLSGATITSTGTNPKTYTVSWTATNGGIYRPQIILNDFNCPYQISGQLVELYINVLNTNPALAISDQYLCSSSPITISATGNYGSYNWSTGETTNSIDVTTAGVYSLSVSGACGGGVTSVEIFDSPKFSVGNDTLINRGDSIALEAVLGNGLKAHYDFQKDSVIIVPEYSVQVLPLSISGVYPSSISEAVIRRAYFDITGDTMGNLGIYLAPPNGLMMPLSLYRGGQTSNLQNIGFHPDATDPILNYNNSQIPADSNFIPQGDWLTLNGIGTNGDWNLIVNHYTTSGEADTINYFGLNLGAYEFSWSPSVGLSCTDCANPIASPDTTTTYIVMMTGTNGCVSYDTITITVDLPAVEIIPSDTMVCAAGGVFLDVLTSYSSYLWSTGETTQSIAAPVAGTYSVTVTGTTQDSVDSITIYGGYPIAASNDTTIYVGDSAQLMVDTTGAMFVTWYPNGNLTCAMCPDPIAFPNSTTMYIVDVTYGDGCVSVDSVVVTVNARPNAPTDTLHYIMEADSTLFGLCATLPPFMGNPATTNLLCWTGSFLGIPNITNGAECFDYYALASAQATDTLCVEVCDSAGLCDTTVFVISIASCVWAGDTDTNQVVNNFDLLPIGLGMGETGNIRPNADLNFDCEPNLDWAAATPVTQVNYKHSDTDGDGTITALDTQAIVQNWGQFYVRNTRTVSSNLIPKDFYVEYAQTTPSTTIQVPIILGDSLNPVDSTYGVAFTINYNPLYVDTNTVSVLFDNSWLGTINSDMISISKDFYHQGHIDVGLTRIDHLPRDGFGQLGLIQLTIKDDILKSAFRHLNMHISNVRLITDQEVEIPTNNLPTYVLIQLPTGVEELEDNTGIRIFPNPTRSIISVESHEVLEVVQLYNAMGQVVRTYNVAQNTAQLNIEGLPTGTYILMVQNAKGKYNQRVTIIR